MIFLSSFLLLAWYLLFLLVVFQSLRFMREIPVTSLVVRIFFEARVVGRVVEDHDGHGQAFRRPHIHYWKDARRLGNIYRRLGPVGQE